jgi:catechol 2,3-dioxygenase-like lactoylglutathione lyase family enzyme
MLTHVAIHARDIKTTVEFYKSYCGLIESHRRVDDNVTVVWLAEEAREGEFVLVLIGVPHRDQVDPAPMAHLGYAVDSREEVDRLGALAADDEILVAAPKDAGPVVGYFCMVHDPEGNWIEFSYGQALGR